MLELEDKENEPRNVTRLRAQAWLCFSQLRPGTGLQLRHWLDPYTWLRLCGIKCIEVVAKSVLRNAVGYVQTDEVKVSSALPGSGFSDEEIALVA